MLQRVKAGQASSVQGAWMATRELRELLPVLQLEPSAVRKSSARLRKLSRRLATLGDLEALLTFADELVAADRRGRHAATPVQVEVRKATERARADLTRRKTVHEVRRTTAKLDDLTQQLAESPTERTVLRDLRWAVNARAARRAAALKETIESAGSVYLAERLDAVRASVVKLRFGVDLGVDVASGANDVDRKALARAQTLLDRLHCTQLLIDYVRRVQSKLATPDLKAWRELDSLVMSLETRCRALHARYVRDRDALLLVCERLTARASATNGAAKRKVS